jgi:transcriptional regulator GlxA family with amidase domain
VPEVGDAGERLVLVYVYDGARVLDVTGPLEVFSCANDFGGRYAIRVVSAGGTDVVASSGTRIGADCAVEAVRDRYDVLVVPGGPAWSLTMTQEPVLTAVRDLADHADHTASVCTGAFLLASAGLLAGRRATTHWRFSAELARRFPDVTLEPDAIFVYDGPVITSAGVTAGIDLSLALVEDHYGSGVARAVAKDLVVFMQRPGGQSQFSVRAAMPRTRHDPLREIMDAVVASPAEDHSLQAMARRAGLSVRHLTRLFDEEVGLTPARYVERVRVEAAQGLLEARDDPVHVVARMAGLGSPESLRRAFVRQIGTTPAAYRARFRTTGARPELRREPV